MADFRARVALGEGLAAVGDLRFTHTGLRQFSTFVCGSALERVPTNPRDKHLLKFEKMGFSWVPIGAGRDPQ
jgi:hypothetical protein